MTDNGRVTLYRDEGIVLRTQKLGEADRIVSLLTRSHGRVRAVAKGVRRTTSRFGARVEPFMHVDVQFATGRTLDVITQAETIAPLGVRITDDYGRYTAGTAILETAERFTAEEREPSVQQFHLLAGALRSLAGAEHESPRRLVWSKDTGRSLPETSDARVRDRRSSRTRGPACRRRPEPCSDLHTAGRRADKS